jgi:predicted ABC-type ATPase
VINVTPRMRVFAGPNGSGKSVLKSYLPEPLLGIYLNPDEIEAKVKERGYANLREFGIESFADEVLPVFTGSEFLRS